MHLYLSLKLKDINRIYRAYEDSIEGRFTDSEDYIRFYGQLMENSELIRRSEIWITGFDTFTPLNMEVIQRLLTTAREVNIVMTYEDAKAAEPGSGEAADARFLTTGGGEGLFDLTAFVMENLKNAAEAVGVEWKQEQIPDIRRDSIWENDRAEKITLIKTSNIYEGSGHSRGAHRGRDHHHGHSPHESARYLRDNVCRRFRHDKKDMGNSQESLL